MLKIYFICYGQPFALNSDCFEHVHLYIVGPNHHKKVFDTRFGCPQTITTDRGTVPCVNQYIGNQKEQDNCISPASQRLCRTLAAYDKSINFVSRKRKLGPDVSHGSPRTEDSYERRHRLCKPAFTVEDTEKDLKIKQPMVDNAQDRQTKTQCLQIPTCQSRISKQPVRFRDYVT